MARKFAFNHAPVEQARQQLAQVRADLASAPSANSETSIEEADILEALQEFFKAVSTRRSALLTATEKMERNFTELLDGALRLDESEAGRISLR